MSENEKKQSTTRLMLLRGIGASKGRAKGIAIIAFDGEEFLSKIRKHNLENSNIIVVTDMTSPDWAPYLRNKVIGIVTEEGGLLCHAAIVAREWGIPAVVNVKDCTSKIKDLCEIEIDGEEGVVVVECPS